MSGVEILAMEEVAVDTVFNWSAFFISIGIIFGIFIVTGLTISLTSGDWDNIKIGVIAGTILGSIAGIAFGFVCSIPTEHETQYKVIISDEVSMSDFFAKYELIEQDGRIYVVTEKD